MLVFTLVISCLTTSITLIYGSNIPGSYAILFFTASDFTSITSHIHHWALSLLWLCLFILYGIISPLFSSSIWAHTDLGSSSFSVLTFCLFMLFMGFSRQEYWTGLPFPVDHVLSEFSTMTHLSWVALMAWLIVLLVRQVCGPCDQFSDDWFSMIAVFILSGFDG